MKSFLNYFNSPFKTFNDIYIRFKETKSPLDYFGLYISAFYYLNLISFDWNQNSKKLHLPHSAKPCQCLTMLSISVLFGAIIYQMVILYLHNKTEGNILEFIIIVCFLSIYIVLLIPAVQLKIKSRNMVNFFNCLSEISCKFNN